jgi:predicted RND superfamily exporter protein
LYIDNSIEVWLPRGSEAYRRYQSFLQQYGSDEFIVVAAAVEDPFAAETMKLQRELAARLSAVEGVDRVWDLPSLSDALWAGKPGWEQEARSNPILRNLVLGPDGKTVGMFIWLKSLHGPSARRHTVELIEAAAAAVSTPGFETHLAGAPRMNVALDRASAHDSAIFLPLAIAVCVISLALMLRSLSGVIAPMLAVTVSAAWTLGLMAMTGHSLNVVTTVMPTLHFVLGLSNGIRLASRYQAHFVHGQDHAGAARATLHELMLPLFFMSLTMAVGFLSLLGSDVEPIVELGCFSAIGLIIAFLSNVLVVPGVLALLHRPRAQATNVAATHWSTPAGMAIARHRGLAVTAALLLLVLCTAAIPRIRAESNVLNFFPQDSEIARDYAFVGQRLSGFYTVELDIRCDEALAYDTIDGMKRLDRMLSGQPGVVRVDHIGKMEQLGSRLGSATASGSGASPFSGLAERFYGENDGQVSLRLCVLVNAMSSSEFYPLLSTIRDDAAKTLPPGATWHLTGIVSLLNDSQRALIDTQIRSFAAAFGIVILMIGLLFLSVRAACASVLPNLLPIAFTFAWMAVRGIRLDAATVMIASVAIGIAVDNTIYFLARYRAEKLSSRDSHSAVEATFNSVGQPIVFTSLVAAAGFSILAFAQFQPIVHFGLLTALTMLTALAGALMLTPACAQLCRVWEP